MNALKTLSSFVTQILGTLFPKKEVFPQAAKAKKQAMQFIESYSSKNEFVFERLLSYREFDLNDSMDADRFCKYMETMTSPKNGAIAYCGSADPLTPEQVRGLLLPFMDEFGDRSYRNKEASVIVLRALARDGSIVTIVGDNTNGNIAGYSAVVQPSRRPPDFV